VIFKDDLEKIFGERPFIPAPKALQKEATANPDDEANAGISDSLENKEENDSSIVTESTLEDANDSNTTKKEGKA